MAAGCGRGWGRERSSRRLYGFMSAIGIARVGHHNHADRHTPARECARSVAGVKVGVRVSHARS